MGVRERATDDNTGLQSHPFNEQLAPFTGGVTAYDGGELSATFSQAP